MKVKNGVEKYRDQSIHYLENAFATLDAGEIEKASEFLWGSLAQALKALAASKGIQLRTHWNISDYARELAKELGDKSIYDVFGHASYLHSNFYEAGLRKEDVDSYAEDIRAMVRKLLELIPEEKQEQGV